MIEPTDDTIDALLRKEFDGPVRDEGFSERVMQRLPLRRGRAMWPLWVGVLVGIVACWLGLLHAQILHAGWNDWMHAEWSLPALAVLLVVAGMSLLALWWSVSEAEAG